MAEFFFSPSGARGPMTGYWSDRRKGATDHEKYPKIGPKRIHTFLYKKLFKKTSLQKSCKYFLKKVLVLYYVNEYIYILYGFVCSNVETYLLVIVKLTKKCLCIATCKDYISHCIKQDLKILIHYKLFMLLLDN